MSEIKSVTLRSLVQSGKVTGISTLRGNKSEYSYVTLLNGNKAHNVYFGKKTSEIVNSTFEKGDNIIQFLKNAEIIQTENEAKEVRFKLSVNPQGNYSSKAELMDVFGSEEQTTEFNMELFINQFTSVADRVVTAS